MAVPSVCLPGGTRPCGSPWGVGKGITGGVWPTRMCIDAAVEGQAAVVEQEILDLGQTPVYKPSWLWWSGWNRYGKHGNSDTDFAGNA